MESTGKQTEPDLTIDARAQPSSSTRRRGLNRVRPTFPNIPGLNPESRLVPLPPPTYPIWNIAGSSSLICRRTSCGTLLCCHSALTRHAKPDTFLSTAARRQMLCKRRFILGFFPKGVTLHLTLTIKGRTGRRLCLFPRRAKAANGTGAPGRHGAQTETVKI